MQNKEDLEKQYIMEQLCLKDKINRANCVNLKELKYIAGVDLAYWEQGETEYAVCCIVVLDYNTKTVIEQKYFKDQVITPYIPGCLAFREIPLFLKTKELLEQQPDVYIFDGNGYLHPRHMGVATQAGILMDMPTIGIAKTYYRVHNSNFIMPTNNAFAFEDIIIEGEIYGRALRTHKNVKPIFFSIGNKIDLDTATKIAIEQVTKDSHIPLPTRLADIMTHEVRKQFNL